MHTSCMQANRLHCLVSCLQLHNPGASARLTGYGALCWPILLEAALQGEMAGLGAHSQVGHAAAGIACYTLTEAVPHAALRVPAGDGAVDVGGAIRVPV